MALAKIKNWIEMAKILLKGKKKKKRNHSAMILAMSSFARVITLFLVFYQS